MIKRKNISILRQISKESLQEILDSSTSLSNAINKIGIDGLKTHYLDIIKQRILDDNLSLTKFNINYSNNKSINAGKIDHNKLFIENSNTSRSTVKYRILKENLIEYRCVSCGITDEYNGKQISLQLDHINGIRNDHRLCNLRFLCPNCHSQQDTSFGKNKLKSVKKVSLCSCGNVVSEKGRSCKKCSALSRPKKFEVSKEELEQLIKEKPMVEIGKMFGVSNNAIKKRCVKLEIVLKDMRGYWAKANVGKI